MNNVKYNGWTNFETWLAALWLDEMGGWPPVNEGQEYEAGRDILSFFEGSLPEREHGFFADICNYALRAVNWAEIARRYVEET